MSFWQKFTVLIARIKGKLWGKAEDIKVTDNDLAPTRPYQLRGSGKACLVMKGPDLQETFRLQQGFLVGRSLCCNLVLDDPAVSRIHAKLFQTGGNWVIQDNNSTNGTVVNGRKIRKTCLQTGDEISLGRSVLIFEER